MRPLLSCVLLLMLTGCGTSPEMHYYALSGEQPSGATSLSLQKVSLPGITDRPQIILKSDDNEIIINEYQRWAEPFDDMVRRVLAEDLGATASSSHVKTAQQLNVAIQEFIGDRQGNVILKANWSVTLQRSDHPPTIHHFEKTETADSPDINAITTSMSRVLGELAHAIRGTMAETL